MRENGKYLLTVFVRLAGDGSSAGNSPSRNSSSKIKIGLREKDGNVIAEKTFKVSSHDWVQLSATLRAGTSADDAELFITPMAVGLYDVDMVSLFPEKTFRGHRNGLRADLAQAIADIHPKFVRFPGGCVAHGQGIDNIYRWKNTIGPLYARKPMKNLWGYR